MLRSLRIKFIVIIMTLVGIVLVSVLGTSFVSAWQTQREITDEALERSLRGDLRGRPLIADENGFTRQGPNMLILSVDVNKAGVIVSVNDSTVNIDSQVLTEILNVALTGKSDRGTDETLHIAWRRAQFDDGAWRVVIADTSASFYTLQKLAVRYLGITAFAMCSLLAISIGLSKWVLKPVERAWEQQRRFVADASHELKTPLAVIIANTQILAKDDSISDESKRWIESTADESAHMKNLVEELLELARTDESSSGTKGIMQRVDVDFSELVSGAALEFDAIAFERGCLIEDDVTPDIHIMGDSEWLERLAKILIDNACKYAKSGSTITVRLSREGRNCQLAVNNQGQIIDPEDLPHIFDRFYRTDKARKRETKAGGFGLGLAIAKGIVTSHGGDIVATSSEEEGTTFHAYLPCA